MLVIGVSMSPCRFSVYFLIIWHCTVPFDWITQFLSGPVRARYMVWVPTVLKTVWWLYECLLLRIPFGEIMLPSWQYPISVLFHIHVESIIYSESVSDRLVNVFNNQCTTSWECCRCPRMLLKAVPIGNCVPLNNVVLLHICCYHTYLP